MYSARGWAAPRLETAADYCTTTVAPKVADTLRTTASQVNPKDTGRRSGLRSVLSISILAIAGAAAAGALAMLVRRQLKAVDDLPLDESDPADVENADRSGAKVPGQAPAPAHQDAAMNGQATSSAW
jgi:hypothetical protein